MRRQSLVYIVGAASALERWPPFFRLRLTGSACRAHSERRAHAGSLNIPGMQDKFLSSDDIKSYFNFCLHFIAFGHINCDINPFQCIYPNTQIHNQCYENRNRS